MTEVPTVKIRRASKAFFSSYMSDKEGKKLALSVRVPSPFHAVLFTHTFRTSLPSKVSGR